MSDLFEGRDYTTGDMFIVEFDGAALERLIEMLLELPDVVKNVGVSTMRVGVDIDGLKFSLNSGTWTPGIGTYAYPNKKRMG